MIIKCPSALSTFCNWKCSARYFSVLSKSL
ncbi:DUF3927 domain-containing protein [Escherichia coli]|nr:DUF3927 domain-containing protein [Escherichia coli]TXO04875.1 DUF427 domain-containing protein [Staphylococcus aureus]